uniref:Zinc transporter ZIP1-like n=1 Tax=Phallusia mammillata TaxID=59560 RepID=A0A6F9DT06_9ASCI|nr:zinc transporter ZIP1-like [Phallusia mammillata]
MDLLIAKILSALVLWILSLLFGLMIPYLIWRSRSGRRSPHQCNGHNTLRETDSLLSDEDFCANDASTPSVWDHMKHMYKSICRYDVLSALNCFCGGLFLGILLLELLPESQMGVQKVLDAANIDINFPITEFMVASGLLLVMFIEHGVSATCGKKKPDESSYSVMPRDSLNSTLSAVEINCESADSSSGEDINVVVPRRRRESLASSESTRSLVLIGMLSIHSIFEGLALGLEVSVSPLIQLLLAISVHKSVLAFGLGLRLFETLASTTIAVACTLMFCTASPLGCAVGIIMTRDSDSLPNTTAAALTTAQSETTIIALDKVANLLDVSGTLIASAVLECLATGTFLYVTFIEVIPSEFAHASHGGHDHAEDLIASETPHTSTRRRPRKRHGAKVPIKKMYKLLILLLGFGTVTGLQFV